MSHLFQWDIQGVAASHRDNRDCGGTRCANTYLRYLIGESLTRAAVFIAVTMHNLVFQARLMGSARDAILAGTFPEYLKEFFADYFGNTGYPQWCCDALKSVGVDLLEGLENPKVIPGDGARWEYA